ncbi:hypothetical protein [Syntrophothermus sp.]|uniref:ribonuclease toxin HepT-like protein n=1 Tax=Syntrophothermus sp. TaxID=2736299 RepID=UPI00257A25C9|nr:hypothetical protein [Syntrophothermus sp.]
MKVFPRIATDNINGLPLDDEISCRVLGSYLHDYYCCLERVFMHIARSFGEGIPGGSQWHKELLEEMSLNIPGVRVAVISKRTMAKLNELRGFRHVFRNLYGFNLDPAKEQAVLTSLPSISAAVKKDIVSFFKQMDEILLQ